jgi:hypothetical protein
MDDSIRAKLKPGARVRVTQQIAARHYAWANEVVGTVTDYEQKQTGSWFAHAKDDKLWLDRLTVRKDDGEMTMLNLDEFSHIEVLDPQPAGAAAGAEGKKNESDLPL